MPEHPKGNKIKRSIVLSLLDLQICKIQR